MGKTTYANIGKCTRSRILWRRDRTKAKRAVKHGIDIYIDIYIKIYAYTRQGNTARSGNISDIINYKRGRRAGTSGGKEGAGGGIEQGGASGKKGRFVPKTEKRVRRGKSLDISGAGGYTQTSVRPRMVVGRAAERG